MVMALFFAPFGLPAFLCVSACCSVSGLVLGASTFFPFGKGGLMRHYVSIRFFGGAVGTQKLWRPTDPLPPYQNDKPTGFHLLLSTATPYNVHYVKLFHGYAQGIHRDL